MPEDIKGALNIVLPSLQFSGIILHEHEVLLKRAEEELNKQEYSLSIIMSHAAIEICTERAFKLLFSFKKIEYLYEAIVKPSWKYNNLSKNSQHVRKLYTALSGEAFDKTNPLWADLETHFEKRNGIAHRGVPSTKQEAELSVAVAKKYFKHINDTLEVIKPPNWGV
jgi:HEPN domain-containing protein